MDKILLARDIFLLLLYVLTSLLALVGNSLVFRISLQRPCNFFSQSKTKLSLSSIRIFLLNLAFADTLTGLTILFQFIFCSKYFLENYFFSSYICVFNKSIQMLGYNASTLTICVIAFDRYRLIQNPLQKYYRRKMSGTILPIWILSSLFSSSCLISMKVHTYFNSYDKLIGCEILFPSTGKYFSSDYIRKIHVLCLVFLFYLIPLLLISILCILTMRVIARRCIIGVQQFQTFEQTRTRSIGLLMITFILFALSHSPIHLIHLRDFVISSSIVSPVLSTTPANKCNDSTVYLFFYWLSLFSCCHNPIVYSWFNRQFRTLFFKCCRSIFYCGRH